MNSWIAIVAAGLISGLLGIVIGVGFTADDTTDLGTTLDRVSRSPCR